MYVSKHILVCMNKMHFEFTLVPLKIFKIFIESLFPKALHWTLWR
jgi:hypothetical protein